MNKSNSCQSNETIMPLTEVMLELVRASVLDEEPIIPKDTVVDWNKLMDISQEQGLIAWVYDGICKLSVLQQPSRSSRISWGMSAQEIWDRYYKQKIVLSEMVKVCQQNGIRLLLMKGIGLSVLYPKPQSRPSGDIDIFLFEDYEKGNRLFGDGVNIFVNKHAAFDYHGVHVENHLTPLDKDNKFERRIDAYLQSEYGNVCLVQEGYYTFSPMPNLVYLITHSLHHFNPHTAVPLRNIIDITIFTRFYQTDLNPNMCYRILSKLKLYSAFELFIRLGESLLGIDLSQYHKGYVQEMDMEVVRGYILKTGSKISVSKELPIMEQIRLLFRNYKQLRRVYRYLPSKRKSLLAETYRHNVGLILKDLVGIPEEEKLIQGLRKKRN